MKKETLYEKACDEETKGNYKESFNLMKLAAENNEISAYNSLGYYYDHGVGTRKDHKKAFYWYKKASRKEVFPASRNIGLTYKERGNMVLAKLWLKKALSAGDEDSALDIAKIYLHKNRKDNIRKAQQYLEIVVKSKTVFEDYRQEAILLLKQMKQMLK